MNTSAYAERLRNDRHIRTYTKEGTKFFVVDTKRVTLRGIPWLELGNWGKRRFENLLMLGANTRERMKVVYA